MKIRITENEWMHDANRWACLPDQNGKLWCYSSHRTVRGSVIEVTYK